MMTRTHQAYPARFRTVLAAAALSSLIAGCAGAPEPAASEASSSAAGFPVEVSSCGYTSTVTTAPSRAIALNQGATEVMLALGLQKSMAGTAYLDDAVAPQWKEAYETVPVLAKEYPSHEQLLAKTPDFIYASYASAFEDKVAGSQSDLESNNIASYLSPFGCKDKTQQPEASFEAIWDEISTVAAAFGVPERAEEIEAEQRRTVESAAETGKSLRVLWYDSGTKTPFVGAGHGAPQVIMDSIGAENIFADLSGNWADGNWEDVLAADPDVIVLADASWDTAADKKKYLESDPVLGQLRAVKEGALVTVPFSQTTPGVRLADGVVSVSEQITALPVDR